MSRRAGWAAVYLERYGLSLVFLVLAGLRAHRLLTSGSLDRSQMTMDLLMELLRQIIWVQLYVYVGLLLLLGRRVTVPPRRFADLVLPIATTFFNLIYSAVALFPLALRINLCPPAWQPACTAVGFCLNLAGLWIAIWAALYLGRSFSVLIEVRSVVLEGAYRRIRHPMYLGYVCFLAGFALANLSWAFLVLVPLHIALLLYRANLEETRLAESSPEYDAYRKRSGFIFPKFRGNG